ncbi:MAG: hypothetical protein WCT32_00200 [Patescibacteria group bacterium]
MSTKYICLHAGCDFASESETDARSHMESKPGHNVVEIVPTDGGVECSMLGDTGEDIEEEELSDDEMMSEEEEKE